MPCYSPNLAFKHKSVKQPLRFVHRKNYRLVDGTDPYTSDLYLQLSKNSDYIPLTLPCGQCIHCRLQNSRDKAIRAQHEAQQYENNCFLTLTYNPESLPKNGSYHLPHVQKFLKRLRFHNSEIKIKSFGCAEYGDKLSRPHYHLCLFNFDFKDKIFHKYSQNDWSDQKWPTYRSDELEELWPYGFSDIGSVTQQSAAYVARYVTKKINGKQKESHYNGKLPERSIAVSHGLGLEWLKQNADAVIARDSIIYKGKELKLPRYYDKYIDKWFPEKFASLKLSRLDNIKKIDRDGTKSRIAVREFLHGLQYKRLKRGYENET